LTANSARKDAKNGAKFAKKELKNIVLGALCAVLSVFAVNELGRTFHVKNSGDPLYAREINALFAGFDRPFTAGQGLHFSDGPGGSAVCLRAPATGFTAEAAATTQGLNVGDEDLPIYAPCEIVGSVYAGTAAEHRRALQVQTATASATGKFAVCAVPLAAGRAGRIHVAGVCLCLVQTASGDLYADIANSGDTFLTGSPTDGDAQILWEDGGSSSTTHLALVRFPVGGSGGGAGMAWARAVADVPITLSGTQTVDGVALVAGNVCLAAAQDDDTTNGLYAVASGDWSRTGTLAPGMAVTIIEGTEYANTIWICGQEADITLGVSSLPFNLYVPNAASVVRWAKAASNSTETLTCSGTSSTPDGVTISAGDYVLYKKTGNIGTPANGFYRVASGAWKLAPVQPTVVCAVNGATNGQQIFFNFGGVWTPNKATYQ